jgi:hypothetical protein
VCKRPFSFFETNTIPPPLTLFFLKFSSPHSYLLFNHLLFCTFFLSLYLPHHFYPTRSSFLSSFIPPFPPSFLSSFISFPQVFLSLFFYPSFLARSSFLASFIPYPSFPTLFLFLYSLVSAFLFRPYPLPSLSLSPLPFPLISPTSPPSFQGPSTLLFTISIPSFYTFQFFLFIFPTAETIFHLRSLFTTSAPSSL